MTVLIYEVQKDPDSVEDFTVDWSSRLESGETIQTSSFIAPSGITVDSDTNDDSTATVWVSGGTLRQTYKVVNRVTTSGGRTFDQTITIIVKEH